MSIQGRTLKIIIFSVLLAVAAAVLCLFSACGDSRVFITLYDGDKVYSTVLTDDNGYVALPTPEKEGYTFDRWFNDRNLRFPYSNNRFTGNSSLYISWIPNEYILTFDSGDGAFEDGEALRPVSIKSGDGLYEAANNIPIPRREHYEFGGWTFEDEIVDMSATFEYASNVTFRVKWIPHTSVVTYDPDGGTVIDHEGNGYTEITQQVVDYGLNFTPYTAEKAGYDFVGWFIGDDNQLEAQLWTTESDFSVVAKYSPKVYTVLFTNLDDGVYGSNIVTYNESYDFFSEYERELPGREFIGWECTVGGVTYNIDTEYDGKVWTIAGDRDEIILTAVYRGLSYNLTLNDGGTLTEVPVSYGSAVELPEDPKSDGKVFVGWYMDDGVRLLPYSTWQYPENRTAYARFENKTIAIPFEVQYYLENGDGSFSQQGGYNAFGLENEIITIDARNFDSKFDDYFFDEDFSRDELHNSPFVLTLAEGENDGNVLKYFFEREKYTYTLAVSGQNIAFTARWGQIITLPTPNKEGYEFEGWSPDMGDSLVSGDFVMPKNNVMLTAEWSQDCKTYTVMLDGEYAFVLSYGEILTPSQRIGLRLDNTFAKYFMGWSLDGVMVIPTDRISSMTVWQVDGGIKLKNGTYRLDLVSVWQPIDAEYCVDIYLESADGTFVKSEYGEYSYKDYGNVGTMVFLNPDLEAPEGYAYDPSQLGNKLVAQLSSDPQTVLSAYFKRTEYTVTFMVDGVEITRKVGWGKPVSDVYVDGYVINDWLFNGEHFDGTMPREDICLIADFTPKKYIILFENNYNGFDKTEAAFNAEYDFVGLAKDNGENIFAGIIVENRFISAEELIEKSVWDIDGGKENINGDYELTVLMVWKREAAA